MLAHPNVWTRGWIVGVRKCCLQLRLVSPWNPAVFEQSAGTHRNPFVLLNAFAFHLRSPGSEHCCPENHQPEICKECTTDRLDAYGCVEGIDKRIYWATRDQIARTDFHNNVGMDVMWSFILLTIPSLIPNNALSHEVPLVFGWLVNVIFGDLSCQSGIKNNGQQ